VHGIIWGDIALLARFSLHTVKKNTRCSGKTDTLRRFYTRSNGPESKRMVAPRWLRLTSFKLLRQLQGCEPLKRKRSLRLHRSLFSPRSRRVVQIQNLARTSFPSFSLRTPKRYSNLAPLSILFTIYCHSVTLRPSDRRTAPHRAPLHILT
jgi:hypothetical protein